MRLALRERTLWWVFALSALSILIVLFILVTRWGAILASQPAYLVTLVIVGSMGSIGIVVSHVSTNRSAQRQRSPAWVLVRRAIALITVGIVAGALLWLRPIPATQTAIDSMRSGAGITVTSSSSMIQIRPDAGAPTSGLIFFPGALVDPRAYVPLLRRVSVAGFVVDIVKPPYGIAFLSTNAPSGIIGRDSHVTRWVVGGHSLGGVAASRFVQTKRNRVVGLVLWASYPSSSISDASWLQVSSISGSNDGLSTTAKIEASREKLPPSTTFVVVKGAVHSDFGDYGTQRGDGIPTISHAEAQAQIESATIDLLRSVEAAQP
jgi:hypothetical protein